MPEPYTDTTVDLVARTLWAEAAPGSTDPPTPTCYEDARKVLGALAEAGLLIPEGTPGVEVDTEVGFIGPTGAWILADDHYGIPATHRRPVIRLPAQPIGETP